MRESEQPPPRHGTAHGRHGVPQPASPGAAPAWKESEGTGVTAVPPWHRGASPCRSAGRPHWGNSLHCRSVGSRIIPLSVSPTPFTAVLYLSPPVSQRKGEGAAAASGRLTPQAAPHQRAPATQTIPTAGTENNCSSHVAEEPSAEEPVSTGVSTYLPSFVYTKSRKATMACSTATRVGAPRGDGGPRMEGTRAEPKTRCQHEAH